MFAIIFVFILGKSVNYSVNPSRQNMNSRCDTWNQPRLSFLLYFIACIQIRALSVIQSALRLGR